MNITRFIAHVIDHHDLLALSHVETPLGPSFPHDFFTQYIRHALQDDLRRLACFPARNGCVGSAFRRILDDPADFVPASQQIAGHLYQTMWTAPYSHLIHSGDVLFALVEEDGEQSLAILKIDPSDAIIRHLVLTPAGPQVVFEARDDRLPPVDEKTVQKIAILFDRRRMDPEPHDLLLLDNNIKHVKVARFFWDGFLGCRLNRDGREVAHVLSQRPKSVVNRVVVGEQRLTASDQIRVAYAASDILKQGQPLNARSFGRKVVQEAHLESPKAEAVEASLVQEVTSTGPRAERIAEDETVPVDGATASRLCQESTYILDGVIRVTGPTDVMRDASRVKVVESKSGQITVTIKAQSLAIG